MKKYKHISEGERWQIYALLREKYEQKEIAHRLGRSCPTISREINRNSIDGVYMPKKAQRQYDIRRSEINKGRSKLKSNPEFISIIKQYMIKEKRAPDSISGTKKVPVSTQTIYTYIKTREPSLKAHLKYKRGYKKHGTVEKRGKPKENYRHISERPAIVELRERIGDMEVDTIHSAGNERKGGLVTIVDRKTKYLLCDKVDRRTAKQVGDVLIEQMKTLPKEKLLTITADNGKEFYDFMRVESELNTLLYFANTYASYERGTNEQTNGMIRKFFPKGTDFSKISSGEIAKVVDIINRKPRKSLGYLSAYEAFHGITLPL